LLGGIFTGMPRWSDPYDWTYGSKNVWKYKNGKYKNRWIEQTQLHRPMKDHRSFYFNDAIWHYSIEGNKENRLAAQNESSLTEWKIENGLFLNRSIRITGMDNSLFPPILVPNSKNTTTENGPNDIFTFKGSYTTL